MSRILFGLFIIFFLKPDVKAQLVNSSTFNLIGKINVESAKILLIPVGDSSYFPEKRGVVERPINHGQFNFKGVISYPYAFILQVINDSNKMLYVSSVFFIDSGTQRINCNINSIREKLKLENKTAEDEKSYDKANTTINKEFSDLYERNDSLYNKFNHKVPPEILSTYTKEYRILEHKKDLILWRYTKEHPNSFVALWELVGRSNSGYRPIYDSIYDQFSINIKQTVTGKRLYDQLRSAAILNIGNKFPRLLLRNIKNEKSAISINGKKNYTLVDFWFSHCSPCISQFDELKNLYQKYNSNNKLDILSISVDDSAHVNDWKSVIAKYNLPWKQYLDLNGKEATRLSVHQFPTNFLLDKSGKIVATNIEPNELRLLLEKM